uniref:SH2 domain-containing protein n=1 Tax=Gadus morhua TaxID=8049 RepID=A0A8C5F6S7_GADMO
QPKYFYLPSGQTLPMINSDPPQPHKPFTADFRRTIDTDLKSAMNQPVSGYQGVCFPFLHQDGSFLVRNSSGQDVEQPYTLAVLYNGKVYNIPVRFIQTTQQYALGREKKGEEHFSSISSIIENHIKNPLVLIDSQSNTRDTTKLQHAVRP